MKIRVLGGGWYGCHIALSLIRLVQKNPDDYRLDGSMKLRFEWDAETGEERFDQIGTLLDQLSAVRS